MADRLPTTMTTSYGRFTFGSSTETEAISITPVYDTSGRTVSYSVFSITLKTHLSKPTESELKAETQAAIAELTAPARPFIYSGRGVGNLSINTANIKDVVWGPKPRLLNFSPIGAGLVVELTWQVEIAIPTCSDATYAFSAMEFCYKVTYDRDRAGYTTRTYSGFVRIPQTRRAPDDRRLSDTADNYLEKITPPVPPGFRRVSQSWVLDESKCRGDFSITDEQLPPYAPPPGCVEASFEHIYQSQKLAEWTATISGEYEMARGADPGSAISLFIAKSQERMTFVKRLMKKRNGEPVAPIPVAGSISEPNAYGRTKVRISITYRVAGPFFDQIIKNGMLFYQIGEKGDQDHQSEWAASMKTVWSPRGHVNMRFSVGDDAIIDLCRPAQPQTMSTQTTRGSAANTVIQGSLGALEGVLRALFDPPTKESSWMRYRPIITISPDPGRVVVETLPNAAIPIGTPQPEWNALGPLPPTTGRSVFAPLTSPLTASPGYGGKTHVQQRTRPTVYVTFSGEAIRAGYPIPIPELVTVNGAKPVLVGQPVFTQWIMMDSIVPIYRAVWQMTYVYTDEGGVPVLTHPVPDSRGLA